MKVISLFDGMSCAMQALKNLGVEDIEYHACEIDKYALHVSEKNHPEIIHHGDVRQFAGFDCDLLVAGSPCQGFSSAGSGLNFDDHRSKLFFEFVRILEESKPTYFLLENVRMKKEHQDKISELLGVEPIVINSALLSAQNRVRLYWTNMPGIEQPNDKCVVLADIVESGVVDREKSYCIDANYFKGGNLTQYFDKKRRQLVFIGDDYRKLSPTECERLQTVPDGYTNHVSNTQRYKMLGNGFTVSVIEHLLKNML